MDTKAWGPGLWRSMFMIAANYPEKIEQNNKEHAILQKHYRSYYTNLKYMLPCKFCRDSFSIFIKQIPVEDYLDSRKNMLLWCYKLKDLVNKKLIRQEELLFELEVDKLKNNGGLTKTKMIDLRKKIFYTTPSPPFKEVYDYYISFRAKSCSSITKVCSK